MATKRPITVQELKSYVTFARARVDVAAVEAAVKNGGLLELISSQYSDPGPDYTEVRLNGRVIVHMDGY